MYPPPSDKNKNTPKRPEGIRELPAFLRELLSGFFSRLFYVFGLIWKAAPASLFLMSFFAILSGVIPVVTAYLSKDIINALVDAQGNLEIRFQPILLLILILFGFRFLKQTISRLNHMTVRIAGELVTKHIRLMIIEKSEEIDLASFDDPEFYERLENAQREAGSRPVSIISSTFDVISNIISLVSFIVVLATLSPWAPILIILLAFPSAVINFHFRKQTYRYVRRNSKARREMNYYANVLVSKDHAKEMKLLDLPDTFIGKFKAVFTEYFAGIRHLIVKETVWLTVLGILTTLGNCALFLYIAYQIFRGELRVGDYSLFTGALTSVSTAVVSLITTSSSVYEGTLFIDNLILFMKEKRKIFLVGSKTEPKRNTAHSIEFSHVYFRYPGTEHWVLEDLCFRIEGGQTVVLVGLNGAGKTTLIKLLTRLYDPTEGTILLDGIDIRTIDPKEYYDLFGILFQDFGKYAVTVRENIAFGNVHRPIDEERIRAAAKEGDADTFINLLPDNYDTPLTRMFEPNGMELSGGQWQKLSVSRAYYNDSDILILDEPTAALDAIAEQEIFNKFDELRNGKTTLFVSHRLSSAVNADSIIVLSGGKITEHGSHAQLMENGGQYAEMFMAQARRYNEGSAAAPEASLHPHNHIAGSDDSDDTTEDMPVFSDPAML